MGDGFYAIYDAHHDSVRRFIQATLRDPWAVDDLMQETFLRVLQKRDTIREPAKLRQWIFRIALNLCRDHLRQRASGPRTAQAHPESVQLLEQMPAPSFTEAALASHQMTACVQHKITLLPESLRTVLWFFDVEAMPQHEIAQMLGIPVENVKVRLHRARKRLKQILQTHCTFERDERGVLVCEPVLPADH
jgi:RNA polymerase sigma-70 factor (ECF subfamily)